MAIRGIYNADGTTTYTVADQRNIHSKSFGNKVIYGDSALVVSAQSTPNMTVKVSSGECSINGAILQNTASTNLTITSNTASYARIDAIVAYINGTTYELRVLKGTAAATPSAPDCSSNMYIKLAEVYVGVGVSSIQASNITDTRGDIIISSLSQEIIALKNTVNNLNAPSSIQILGSYPYTPATIQAIPNRIYTIGGYEVAEVKGMDLSKMQNGDKIYFSVETDAGSITLKKVGGNFWLPVDSLTLSKNVVYTMMYVNGVMRMMVY